MSRVLMSDSAALFQMLEPSFLKRGGWEIARLSSPDGLLESARHNPPDLILIDSDAFGEEISSRLATLKAEPALGSIPIVTVGAPAAAERCRAAGADASIGRPVDPEALVCLLCSLARVARRQEARSPARIPVRIETAAGPLRGRLKDIGAGGLFIALPDPLPIREQIDVRMRLPIGRVQRRVRARGVVVRQVFADRESHLISGVGIRFTQVDDPDRRLIAAFVNGSPMRDGAPAQVLGAVSAT